MNLTELLLQAISDLKAQKINSKSILFVDNENVSLKNELLFFIKPELIDTSGQINHSEIFKLIERKINEFNFVIKSVLFLSGEYLRKYQIIDQHYGVINQLSRDAKNNLSDNAKQVFRQKFGVDPAESDILGSIEFLNRFPSYNALSLNYLWQNISYEKLGGGTYCASMNMDGTPIYMLNGFHPNQLEHFTKDSSSIFVFTLTTDTDWEIARQEFTGATNPDKFYPLTFAP